MTSGSRPRCICSTVGYQAQAWSKAYYPAECPEEWQLAYFMNDFPGIYLPEDAWPDAEQLSMISDELEGEFMLVLEWPSAASLDDSRALLKKLEPIASHVVGLVLKLEAGQLEARLPLLQMLRERYPVNVSAVKAFSPAQLDQLEQLAVGQVWMPALQDEPVAVDDCLVVLLPVQDLREIRNLLEQLAGVQEQGTMVGLFFEPGDQAPQRAQEVRTVIELLELA